MSDDGEVSESGLDAYSRVVTSVAEDLRARVAALSVDAVIRGTRVVRGAGSGVVFTGDGFLLTNAHVVANGTGGQAAFEDGTAGPFEVVGSDPLSDLAVVRVSGGRRRRRPSATPRPSRSGSSWWPWATRSACPAA